jgi:hypothetical protein
MRLLAHRPAADDRWFEHLAHDRARVIRLVEGVRVWPPAITEAEWLSCTQSTTMLGIDSKIEMHARLAAETDAEYAAQAQMIRHIFGYPF